MAHLAVLESRPGKPPQGQETGAHSKVWSNLHPDLLRERNSQGAVNDGTQTPP